MVRSKKRSALTSTPIMLSVCTDISIYIAAFLVYDELAGQQLRKVPVLLFTAALTLMLSDIKEAAVSVYFIKRRERIRKGLVTDRR